MGPLEPSRDDLIKQLSGSPSQPSAGGVAKSGFGAAASAVSPILGFAFNILSTMFSNSLTQQRASQQNALNLAQWQRENAYNSPSAQMQRLAAAGINPALAYANGDLMNEAAASPQSTSGEVFSPVQIDPLTAAQVNQLNSQAELNRSNIPVNQQKANELKESARNLQLEGNFAAATFAQRVAAGLASGRLATERDQEELKYVAENVKADADRIRHVADKAYYEKLISQEDYHRAIDSARQMRALADISEYERNQAHFWSEVYRRAIDLVQTTEDVFGFLYRLYERGHSSLVEVGDYFFPDKP